MRILSFVNLAGVLALGVLCVAQWNGNRLLNGEIGRLESLRADQTRELDGRDKTIAGMAQDLDELRDKITKLGDALHSAQSELLVEKEKTRTLDGECTQLKDSISAWKNAVETRDNRIGADNERIRALADSLNDTIMKYNDLAAGHNETVQLLNKRTAELNKLAERLRETSKQN